MRKSFWSAIGLAGFVLVGTVLGTALGSDPGSSVAAEGAQSPPDGSRVSRCPSEREVEEYARKTGSDYKPKVTCRGSTEVEGRRPSGEVDWYALSPDEREAIDRRMDRREKDQLLSAQWENGGRGACGYQGRLPDGREISLQLFVCQPDASARDVIEQMYP